MKARFYEVVTDTVCWSCHRDYSVSHPLFFRKWASKVNFCPFCGTPTDEVISTFEAEYAEVNGR